MPIKIDARYIAAAFIVVLLATFTYLVRFSGQLYLYNENQWMEHIQLLLILAAGIVFWKQTGNSLLGKNVPTELPIKRLALFAALLCFSFLVREMSVKQSGIDWLIYIVDGTGFKILMAVLWVPALINIAKRWSCYMHIVRQVFFSATAVFTMLAAVFMLIGALYDKEIIVVEYFRFYEELFEMTGYGFLLLAAMSYAEDMAHVDIRQLAHSPA